MGYPKGGLCNKLPASCSKLPAIIQPASERNFLPNAAKMMLLADSFNLHDFRLSCIEDRQLARME